MNTFSTKIAKKDEQKLKDFITSKNVSFEPMQYTSFRAKGNGFVAILYESGKFVLQGGEIDSLAKEIEGVILGKSPISDKKISDKEQSSESEIFVPHIGADESGKGDFFGPLVIAGVYVDENNRQQFLDAGIKDSKKLSDSMIKKLAIQIKNNAIFSVVIIKPEKYNELYQKVGNLNKLLAWGHARVIENILQKQKCEYALSDKFGDESLIKNALMKEGRQIRLEQRTKAEDDIAVACASVIARYEFVKNMEEMSVKYGIEFPKGASNKVIEAGKEFVKKQNSQILKEVAKLHFKTTNEVT